MPTSGSPPIRTPPLARVAAAGRLNRATSMPFAAGRRPAARSAGPRSTGHPESIIYAAPTRCAPSAPSPPPAAKRTPPRVVRPALAAAGEVVRRTERAVEAGPVRARGEHLLELDETPRPPADVS